MVFDVNIASTLLAIFLINLILSGDNAVVIALATLNLKDKDKKKGIFWGTFGAVAARIVLTAGAVYLLELPYLQAIGGLLLLIIAVKLLADENMDDNKFKTPGSLPEAVKIIIFADVIMSLDNVLAVAGAAQGNMLLIVLGLLISIPVVIFGSSLLSALMHRWPLLIMAGAGLLGYTAGDMILRDFSISGSLNNFEQIVPWMSAVIVILIGRGIRRQRPQAAIQVVNKKKDSQKM